MSSSIYPTLPPPLSTFSLPLFATLGIALTLFFLLTRRSGSPASRLPLPPGPKPVPLLGNVLDMPKEYECLTYNEWRGVYGAFIHIRLNCMFTGLFLPFPTRMVLFTSCSPSLPQLVLLTWLAPMPRVVCRPAVPHISYIIYHISPIMTPLSFFFCHGFSFGSTPSNLDASSDFDFRGPF